MYEILIQFETGETKRFKGNFIIEGSFVRINFDHDNDKKTPQRTAVYPSHVIMYMDCEVIQSGVHHD